MNGAKKKVKQAASNDGTEIPCGQCSIVSHLWYCNQCTQQKCCASKAVRLLMIQIIVSCGQFDGIRRSMWSRCWMIQEIRRESTANLDADLLESKGRVCMYVYITFPKVPFQVYIAAVVSSWVLLRAGT